MRVQTALGLRVFVASAFAAFATMGLGFAALPEVDTGMAWGGRAFYLALGVCTAIVAVRWWRCALTIEGDQLVSREAFRTRRIDLTEIRDVSAEQSDWLMFWVIVVDTENRTYWFEDVRDYPWRKERMERAARMLRTQATAAGADL